MESGALIKWLNYWDDLDKAEGTLKEAKESVIKARDALQSTMARDTKLKKLKAQSKANLRAWQNG